MFLRPVRNLLILTIHLFLFTFPLESLPMESLHGDAQNVSQRLGNLSNSVVFDQFHSQTTSPDWQHYTQCLGNFCNETVDNPGNGSLALQKVRIRRASAGESGDTFFPVDSYTSCRVPSGLRTAEIRCKEWPSSIKCISYCVYGSTYDEGIQRINTCQYKDNRWSKDFDECTPFVDCQLKLVSPGNIKCIRNEVTNPPQCDVSCGMYEDKDEIKQQTYTCHASGKWMPALPFCAETRGDTKLARAPKENEHKSLAYP